MKTYQSMVKPIQPNTNRRVTEIGKMKNIEQKTKISVAVRICKIPICLPFIEACDLWAGLCDLLREGCKSNPAHPRAWFL